MDPKAMNDPEYLKILGAITRAETPEQAGEVYAELEKAIRSRQIGEITTITDTCISSRWIVERNPMTDAIIFRCAYSVNWKHQTFTVEKDMIDFHNRNINDLLKEVFEDFSKHFANHFAADMLNGVAHAFRPQINGSLRKI